MLRLSERDVNMFWDLAAAPLHSISERLGDVVPKLSSITSAKSIQYRRVCGYFGNTLNSRQPKNEIVVLHIHQEYTMNSSMMSFSNTALDQLQKCCLQSCCGNMAG
jgi:hypothetical protein